MANPPNGVEEQNKEVRWVAVTLGWTSNATREGNGSRLQGFAAIPSSAKTRGVLDQYTSTTSCFALLQTQPKLKELFQSWDVVRQYQMNWLFYREFLIIEAGPFIATRLSPQFIIPI
jgi:hypothetical protein